MEEILIINKPKNWTSNDVVQKVKGILKVKKVGHGGTLDPLATGVLVLGINNGTKLLSKFLVDEKEYIAKIEFGFNTTTYDLEGDVINRSDKIIEIDNIKNILEYYLNNHEQYPPIYSAIKKNGKPLYDYARKNIDVVIEPRTMKVIKYEILDFKDNILEIRMTVPKGFYIRSFSNDIGIKLDTYATLINLIRTRSGDFKIEDAVKIESLINENL